MDKSESKYFHTARRMDEALLLLLREKDFEYVTVKEICAKAQVNRSTFYLHYETIGDLLHETIQWINEKFNSSYSQKEIAIKGKSLEELFFMTDEWLIPYLNFIKENKHIYKAIHMNAAVFGVEKAFKNFFGNVFSPILSEYGIAEKQHVYIMDFYRYGLTAVIMRWVENDCTEPVAYIADIIKSFFSGQQTLGKVK